MKALIHGAAYLRICIPVWFHRQKQCRSITAMSRYKAATMMLENQQVQIWNGILCSSFLPKNVNIPALSEKHWWTRAYVGHVPVCSFVGLNCERLSRGFELQADSFYKHLHRIWKKNFLKTSLKKHMWNLKD